MLQHIVFRLLFDPIDLVEAVFFPNLHVANRAFGFELVKLVELNVEGFEVSRFHKLTITLDQVPSFSERTTAKNLLDKGDHRIKYL